MWISFTCRYEPCGSYRKNGFQEGRSKEMRTKVFIDALNLGNLLLNDAVVTSFVTDVQDERADACSMKCKSTMKRLLLTAR